MASLNLMSNAVDIPDEGTLMCQSCRVHVTEAELDAGHYRTEWHRYNVKRRCGGQLPIAREEFERQLAELLASQNTKKPKPHSFECRLCRKTYSSEAALAQHKNTKKHLKKLASQPQSQPGAAAPAQPSSHASAASPPSSSSSASQPPQVAVADADAEGASASSSPPPRGVSFSPDVAVYDIPSSTSSSKKLLQEDQGLNDALSALAVEEKLKLKDGEGTDDEDDEEDGMFDDGESDEEEDEQGESLFDAGSDGEAQEMLDAEAIPLGTCLFSGKEFDKLEDCLDHMLKKYGFFIPSVENLVSVEDMLSYLGAKIGMGRECLYCTRKAVYPSLLAVRQHMIAKNHCKLKFDEDDGELDEFYDFSDKANADDEDVEMSSSKELMVHEPRRLEELMGTGEMLMTDGSVIGTREYRRYYKQRLRPERPSKRSAFISNVTSRYRMLQLPGYTPGTASIRETKRSQQRAAKWRLRLATQNNKTTMKHFRCQINF